jgi:ABC-type transport system substrate-binding protein
MKLSGFPLLVASSLLAAAALHAETRPAYGGTLRASVSIAPASLDPADASQPDSIARGNLTRLMFDTLVVMDGQARLKPALALSWRAESGNQRWQFWLRQGVHLHDGASLTPDMVAASLRTTNPGWKVFAATDSIVIESDVPAPDIPAQLAQARNAIAKRSAGKPVGTGPFRVVDFQPGKRLSLSAEEAYWGGRAFVDAIEIDLGRNGRDQLINLDLGKTDIAEVAAEQAHRAVVEGRRLISSEPLELMTLIFSGDPQSPDEAKLREALALSIDRASIRSVILQGIGEPTSAILPGWISGYAFVFPAGQNLQRARQLRGEVRQAPVWSLAYDGTDPLARVIAERIALNARDAGITLQTGITSKPTLKMVRIPLASLDARLALTSAAGVMGLAAPHFGGSSAEDMYQAENAILQTRGVIPLFQLPACYVVSPVVHDAMEDRAGNWHLENVWLGSKAQ